jgi:mono/diheme cytochrome c family protein
MFVISPRHWEAYTFTVKHIQLSRLILLGLAFAVFTVSARAQNAAAISAVVKQYCIGCHGERVKTVGLNLEAVDWTRIGSMPELGEKVLRKVRGGEMPPAGAPRPTPAERSAFANFLETTLDRTAAASPDPGTPALRRLNRAEYVNSVRDLLGLDVDAIDLRSSLPADDSGYGFDNIGDVLSVSPLLLENYFTAARLVSRLAIGTVTPRAEQAIYEVPRFLGQNDRVSEALPFGSRGGAAIRHHFPVSGDYLLKIRLKTTYDGSRILGIAESHDMDLWLDGARVAQTTVGGEGKRASRYDTALRLDPAATASDPSTSAASEKLADADFQTKISVSAGTHTVGVSFQRETWEDESLLPPPIANRDDLEPGIGSVVIDGPVAVKQNDTNAGDRLKRGWRECSKAETKGLEETCAWRFLSGVARLAFRRPITDQDREALLIPYRQARTQARVADGMEMALARILVSPEFLFRIERDPAGVKPGTSYRVSDLELATRLSFFLWSSIPDEPLLEAAEHGRLRDAAELRRQVARMLGDERARSLVDNFAGQWLYLRNMKTVQPDLGEFSEFDENLRGALTSEMELFVAENIRADRPLTELLSADYTFLNERLARHYGIRGVYGSHLRRVTLAKSERHGLLGKGGLLTVTSYANRTSPVIRGKWLLENMLGTPPPPPPPNVPDLQEKSADGKVLPMRQAMEKHRANPACATCHQRMDPLGFALENFDAVGRWRATSGSDNTPVDASATTPDGVRFDGPTGLREVLLSRKQEFVTTATAKLLTYALGRGLQYYDQPTVRAIVRRRSADQLKWSDVIEGIVLSTPFQMRRKTLSSDK